ncbi:MAG: uncharacterized protein PWR13_825 [Archaeoglobi archaeon]|nr:uncharacterized protein [Archaeoglobi archaeon]MDK2781797.1 uncharacterized protein [Archaeoglobi archaeon]
MRAVIDTNVLVYDTFEDSIHHDEAKNLLDKLEEWIIPAIVLHEYVWVLKSLEVASDDVLHKVEEYLTHHKTKLAWESERVVLSALNIVVREKINLSRYNDKVILSLAVEEGVPLASFDKRLRGQAMKIGIKTLPSLD